MHGKRSDGDVQREGKEVGKKELEGAVSLGRQNRLVRISQQVEQGGSRKSLLCSLEVAGRTREASDNRRCRV